MFGNLQHFLEAIGYLGIWGILVAETGVLFGVLLPGDSMLLVAGIMSSQGYFSLPLLVVGNILSAFFGNVMGYEVGKRLGRAVLVKHASKFVTEEQLHKVEAFFNKHGVVSIVLARFIPFARTLAPFLAGVSGMDKRSYLLYSAFGAFLWAAGLPITGYFAGKILPPEFIDQIIIASVTGIILVALFPAMRSGVMRVHKARKDRRDKARSGHDKKH